MIKDFFTKNIGMKLGSIAIATILWLVVVSVDDPVTTRTYTQIPVEIMNAQSITDAGKVYEVVDNSDLVSVVVSAKRSVLDSLSRDNFKAVADMSRIDGDLVPVDIKATKYADRIENITLKNKNVKVYIEGLMERQFNIQVSTIGTVPEGYMVGDITLDKNVIKISGPESIVSRVANAGVSVDVDGMKSDISTDSGIVLFDEDGSSVDTAELSLSRTQININVEIWGSVEVPVIAGFSGEPAEGFVVTSPASCTPSSVYISGKAEQVNKVSEIVIPESAVNISGATGDVDVMISLEKFLPNGVVLVSKSSEGTAIVHVSVAPLSSGYVEIPVANISAENVPDGMEATVGGLGEVVALEVKGLPETLQTVNPELIRGIVDLSSITIQEDSEAGIPDAYDVPVQFVFPEGLVGGNNSIMAKVILHKTGETTGAEGDEEEENTDAEEIDESEE